MRSHSYSKEKERGNKNKNKSHNIRCLATCVYSWQFYWHWHAKICTKEELRVYWHVAWLVINELKWHFRVKRRCELIFIFVLGNVTWHLRIWSWTSYRICATSSLLFLLRWIGGFVLNHNHFESCAWEYVNRTRLISMNKSYIVWGHMRAIRCSSKNAKLLGSTHFDERCKSIFDPLKKTSGEHNKLRTFWLFPPPLPLP